MDKGSKRLFFRAWKWALIIALMSAEVWASLDWQDCYLQHPQLQDTIPARCAAMQVPLDHAQKQSRLIHLKVLKVQAKGPGI